MPAEGPLNEQFVLTVGLAVLNASFRDQVLKERIGKRSMQSALADTQFADMKIEPETLATWQELRTQNEETPQLLEVLTGLLESCERIICARGCRVL